MCPGTVNNIGAQVLRQSLDTYIDTLRKYKPELKVAPVFALTVVRRALEAVFERACKTTCDASASLPAVDAVAEANGALADWVALLRKASVSPGGDGIDNPLLNPALIGLQSLQGSGAGAEAVEAEQSHQVQEALKNSFSLTAPAPDPKKLLKRKIGAKELSACFVLLQLSKK